MRRPLDAAETADAAVAAAVVLALLAVGRILAAGTFFQILATVVMAVLAARRRTRVVTMATSASMATALLLGGIGPITQAFVSGLFGWTSGVALRRRLGLLPHVAVSLAVGWPIVAAGTVGFLWVFDEARDLSLENGRNQWTGIANVLRRIGADGVADEGTGFVDWGIEHWWVLIPAIQVIITVGYALIVRRLGRAVLQRVDRAHGPAWVTPAAQDAVSEPLPVRFERQVVVRRAGADTRIGPLPEHPVAGVEPGERVALVGDNGVGKTSLLEAMAGIHPADGLHQGSPGLGRVAGTALIGQAPHSQVLGLTVADDVRWGLDAAGVTAHAVDTQAAIDEVLRRVGLFHLREQPTENLSGGELQRLAVAAAIIRRPRLLLSDESTSMLDGAGRTAVMDLLLSAADDTAVVHSTHLTGDVDACDRSIDLGLTTVDRPPWGSAPALFRKEALRADDVGYVHHAGTPWAHRALENVSFAVERGELLVVQGPNGSGKTTLMRLVAGLARPTEGRILLGDEPLDGPSVDIGVTFQHARLQLLRPTVRAEVASLSGLTDQAAIDEAMRLVGFEPGRDGATRIADLSGGQQRRVLLAGLAARPCRVAVMDEPLAGLDASGQAVLTTILDTLLARGTAVVVVSHDPDWALERADRVLDLDRGRVKVP